MKKSIFIWLLATVLAVGMIVLPASAAVIGVLEYTVSPTTVNIGSDKTGAFTVTVPGPSVDDRYTHYAGVTFALQLPDGVTLNEISYNLPKGSRARDQAPDSGGTIWFNNHGDSNIFAEDMICTITVGYTGASPATITIWEITQTFIRSELDSTDRDTDRKVSDPANRKTVTLVPDSVAVSADATLSDLKVIDTAPPNINRALVPSFEPRTDPPSKPYEVSVPNSVSSITIEANANATGATIDGRGVKSSLNVGPNYFAVNVTSPDGTNKNTYNITVIRDSVADTGKDATLRELSISNSTLEPDFSPNVFSYSASVGHGVPSVIVTAVANNAEGNPRAEVTFSGRSVGEDGVVNLYEGENQVDVNVTSADRTNHNTYSITITRPSPPDGSGGPGGSGSSDSSGTGQDTPRYEDGFSEPTVAIPLGGAGDSMLTLDKSGANGYITGYPDNTIRAENNITRYEAAVLFYHLLSDENTTTVSDAISKFSDVEAGKWYSDAVGYLVSKEVLTGYPDGTFKGDNQITRAEFATLASKFSVWNFAGDIPFPDVSSGHWAYVYIRSAFNNGFITGYPDGTFGPERNIIRAETFVVMNKILGWDAGSAAGGTVGFTDLTGNEWYYNDIVLAVNGKPL